MTYLNFLAAGDDVMALMQRGAEVRKVGETNMNRESSRSHAVFTATVEVATQEESGLTNVRYSRINLIDLAGEPQCACVFAMRTQHCTNWLSAALLGRRACLSDKAPCLVYDCATAPIGVLSHTLQHNVTHQAGGCGGVKLHNN